MRFPAVLLAVFLAGCAVLQPDAEVTVGKRAQARWDALVAGDTKAAYEFLSPGSRAALSLADYASSIRVGFWKSAKVDKVTCESADRCEVAATIEYEFQGRRTKTPLRETWIRDGSEWWYLQR
jgi:hypothetical protein